ncbi:MAG TPA: N-acetyltransferase [Puia sp.]|nr:N-acetyltransferase [Puia sp.]
MNLSKQIFRSDFFVRAATPADRDAVWKILLEVIATGEAFVFDPDTPKHEMLEYWFGSDKYIYVATEGSEIVGSFILKNNQPGGGSHIANGSYVVAKKHSGKGIGTAMGEYSLVEARRLGYKAMQFNIVVKSNTQAVKLWQKLGFNIVGEIPEAFNHRSNGLTNAYIMYRKL